MQRFCLFIPLVALILHTSAATAQTGLEVPSAKPAQTTQPAEITVPPQRRSPRATMMTFLSAMSEERIAQAVQCLDLGEIEPIIRDERGADLAQLLKFCMDRIERVDPEDIPDDPDHASPYIWHHHTRGVISLHRIEEGEYRNEWRFTPQTLQSITDLASHMRSQSIAPGLDDGTAATELPRVLWIRDKIPVSLQNSVFLLEHWQWLGLLLLIFLGLVVHGVVVFVLGVYIKHRLKKSSVFLEGKFTRSTMKPLGLLAMAGMWRWGLAFLALDDQPLTVLLGAVKFFAAVVGVWAFYGLVDLLCGYLTARASRTTNRFDDLLVPLLRKALKVFITAFGLLFIADFMDWDLTTLLTGLGIGGLAVAFAAKETLSNIFGSITVLLDRPFQIGDWVRIGSDEGIVESVGFRSTRIRTFYDSLISIPNGDCVNCTIDNYGARRYRRIKTMLSVLYSTKPSQLEAFCEGIRELIRQHPCTRKDYFHVYVNQFAASSIDVLLYCFVQVPDWASELRERERLFLDIIRLAEKLNVEFAFPTQTVHLFRGETNEDTIEN